MESAHFRQLRASAVPVPLLQGPPRVSGETRRVRHGPDGHLRRAAQASLSVQADGLSDGTAQGRVVPTVGFVQEGGCRRILNHGEVVPGIALLEHLLPEGDEEEDEGEDEEENDGDADELLLPDVRVSGLHVRNQHRANRTSAAHETGSAVAVEGAERVDTHAAVLAQLAFTLVHVFFTPAEGK